MNPDKQMQMVNQVENIFRERGHLTSGGYQTYYTYLDSCKEFGKWVADNVPVSKIQNIRLSDLERYVEYKKENGAASASIMKDLSAIRFMHNKAGNFKHSIPKNNKVFFLNTRSSGKVYRAVSSDEYTALRNLASEQKNDKVYCSAGLQYELGLRVEESVQVRKGQIQEAIKTRELRLDGNQCKHGRKRIVPIETAAQLSVLMDCLARFPDKSSMEKILSSGDTKKDKNSIIQFVYRNQNEITDMHYRLDIGEKTKKRIALKFTCHGMRYAYANRTFEQLQERGYSEHAAKRETSCRLGHNREEITNCYLK